MGDQENVQQTERIPDHQLALYQAITSHWVHAEETRWTLLYNFLMAGTILVLSWAALLPSSSNSMARVALIGLPVAGVFLSVAWLALGVRANGFVHMYNRLGLEAERRLPTDFPRPFTAAEEHRVRIRPAIRWAQSRRVSVAVTILFLALYAFLGIISWLICSQI